MSGVEQVFDLADDLRASAGKIASALYDVYKAEGETFAGDWADNARQTSGQHGKYYPDSITSETRISLGIVVVAGPETGRQQGGMGEGFEFGSRNQPPHLDGLRALGPAEARLLRAADATIGFLLP